MKFSILTIFPEVINAYVGESILGRAIKNKKIKVQAINIRDFTNDKHQTVDDSPYGGGPGMVMKPEPIIKAFRRATGGKESKKTKVLMMSAAGKPFTQKRAAELAKKYSHIILIAGRYEGIDERVKKITKAEEVSVGPYVLTGGELPALTITDAAARHVKGVLGNNESLEDDRHGVGVPVYTRPAEFAFKKKKYKVPEVLLEGNHARIEEWRKDNQKKS